MSEFASLLDSFKRSTQSASAASATESEAGRPPTCRRRPAASPTDVTADRVHPPRRQRPRFLPPAHHRDRGSAGDAGVSEREGSFELSFLVVGAQKAGTSWLHAMLKRCDRLSLPREAKELHFWDWHRRRGIEWYVRQFDFPQQRGISSARSLPPPPLPLYGEITPCYVVLPPSTIDEISARFPNLRIVFVARDLVDRAWSAMTMELRDQTMGLKPGEFATSADARVRGGNKMAKKISTVSRRRLEKESSPSSMPDSYYIERLQSEAHDTRSNYALHLRNWYSRFPPERVLIVNYQEVESDPRGVLLRVVRHIGLTEADARNYVEGLDDADVQRRVNAATGSNEATSRHSLSQRQRLRRQLEDSLRPYARQFNSLLEERGYAWRLEEYAG